jgi:hypothetical protein
MPVAPDDTVEDLSAELLKLIARHRRPQSGGLRSIGDDAAAPVTVEECIDLLTRYGKALEEAREAQRQEAVNHAKAAVDLADRIQTDLEAELAWWTAKAQERIRPAFAVHRVGASREDDIPPSAAPLPDAEANEP